MNDLNLTADEQRAIAALKKVAEKWPESLWLFSASGTLNVLKKKDKKRVVERFGGMDPNYIVASVDIENEGGDW